MDWVHEEVHSVGQRGSPRTGVYVSYTSINLAGFFSLVNGMYCRMHMRMPLHFLEACENCYLIFYMHIIIIIIIN